MHSPVLSQRDRILGNAVFISSPAKLNALVICVHTLQALQKFKTSTKDQAQSPTEKQWNGHKSPSNPWCYRELKCTFYWDQRSISFGNGCISWSLAIFVTIVHSDTMKIVTLRPYLKWFQLSSNFIKARRSLFVAILSSSYFLDTFKG